MRDDRSWLKPGAITTPEGAATRLKVSAQTIRNWARAKVIRHVLEGKPPRFLLCKDDVDLLEEHLRGAQRPRLQLAQAVMNAAQKKRSPPEPSPRALAKAVELVRAAYGDGMQEAGVIKGIQVRVHAYASEALAPYAVMEVRHAEEEA